MRALLPAAPLALLLLAGPGTPASAAGDPEAVLREGNQLFRAGRLEEALETYRQGWEGDAEHAVLAYNLGTTAHHLGRLPEAVLWYRRAARASSGAPDRWLTENLARARRQLGAPRLPPPVPWSWLVGHRTLLLSAAALAAWLCLALVLLGRRRGTLAAGVAALLAVTTLAAAVLGPWLMPEEAVLMGECSSTGGRLAAGSEVWVAGRKSGGYRVYARQGEPLACPAEAVRRIAP